MISQTLQYTATKNNIYHYSIDYEIKKAKYFGEDTIGIYTTLRGAQLLEENICLLSPSHQTRYILQKTRNEFEGLYYTWEIENSPEKTEAYYFNESTNTIRRKSFKFPSNGYSLQAIMYILTTLPIEENSTFEYRLLVPPATFHDIVVTVGEKTNIMLHDKRIEVIQIEIALRHLFSFLLPKITMWVSSTSPHICVKYQRGNETVTLNEDMFKKEIFGY